MKINRKRRVGIYAGAQSPFTGKLSLAIEPVDTPLGICTSSGTVGHSLSMGIADAVIVQAQSTALADALATSIGNQIKQSEDIELVIERAGAYRGIDGLVIIKDDRIGLWGNIKIESL